MTPLYRALSTVLALVAGFTIPLLGVVFFLGVVKVGALAVVGLLVLGAAVTLLLLVARGRLRF